MTVDGFKLTVPNSNNDVFEARNAAVSHQFQSAFLINGLGQALAYFKQHVDDVGGDPETVDSYMTSIMEGAGAGSHLVNVRIRQWEDSTDSWGTAASGDSAITKRDTLAYTLETTEMDSSNPAILEAGEYSSSGKYDPLKVAILETDLSFDPEDQSSDFEGTMTFVLVEDLNQVRDAHYRDTT